MSNVAKPPTTLNALVPLILVDNVDASVRFYERMLDFRRTHAWEPDGRLMWCQMIRDNVGIMLQQTCEEDSFPVPRGAGVTLYIHCQASDDVYRRLVERGADTDPPVVTFYGMQQVFVTDPDGYQLCFQNPA